MKDKKNLKKIYDVQFQYENFLYSDSRTILMVGMRK